MPRKKSYITVTDQFCGAGGSSQGALKAGAEVTLAMNHWKLAIETHATNFPDTAHDCTDISACDPRRYTSTDVLITSPECTNHSLAKGQKRVKSQMDLFNSSVLDASAERSRATMWDVCRFTEYHRYNYIIVENVVDARSWVMFDAWISAMYAMGYKHQCVYHNSMHSHPTPQSRDRMYVHFWKRSNKAPDLNYYPRAWCQHCTKDVDSVQTWKNNEKKFGKYKKQYVYCCPSCAKIVEPYYHAAFNCIDWSDIGTRIGDRKKPLSPNTMKRIAYGNKKYNAFPILINDQHSTGVECRVKSAAEFLGTLTGTAQHYKIVSPFIIKGEHTLQPGYSKSVFETIQTQTVRQSMALLTPPFIVESKKTSNARSVTQPLACATTVPYHGIIQTENWNSFVSYWYGTNQASHITEAIGTIGTVDTCQLVTHNSPNIEDYYYRTIKAKEIQAAMAFHQNYIVKGTAKEQVKQLGNAVTPPAMEWQVKRAIDSLN
jgi:DNA (cytosine-5)-methyltransferase 1